MKATEWVLRGWSTNLCFAQSLARAKARARARAKARARARAKGSLDEKMSYWIELCPDTLSKTADTPEQLVKQLVFQCEVKERLLLKQWCANHLSDLTGSYYISVTAFKHTVHISELRILPWCFSKIDL